MKMSDAFHGTEEIEAESAELKDIGSSCKGEAPAGDDNGFKIFCIKAI